MGQRQLTKRHDDRHCARELHEAVDHRVRSRTDLRSSANSLRTCDPSPKPAKAGPKKLTLRLSHASRRDVVQAWKMPALWHGPSNGTQRARGQSDTGS